MVALQNEFGSLVKLQDIKLIHRNLLHYYTVTMKNQEEKLRKQSHSPQNNKITKRVKRKSNKKNKIPRNKPT